jgi:glycosyl hydrolase family 19 (putative chitinase)
MRAWSSLTQAQVDGLTALLDGFDADEAMSDMRWQSYALATIKHETANTYKPIAEYGKGRGRPYGKKDAETGQIYYGRGFVQLTWKRNYELLGGLLGIDLVNQPDFAMDPETAYQVLSIGMRDGLFTGKKLSDYINDKKTDYLNARKIINAMDKAALIAGYATRFETILKQADEPEADTSSQIVKETTTTTSAQPATDTQPAVVEQSVVQKITSSDQVKNIASTGMSSIGNRLASSTASGGMLEAVGGFFKDNMTLIICGTILVVVAILVWLLIFHHSHKEKQLEATINANPNLNDIHFETKSETNAQP